MSDFFNILGERELEKRTKKAMPSNIDQTKSHTVPNNNGVTLDCKKELLALLGTHFLICNEKIPEKGEDCGFEAYTCNAAIIGAFDGCGGLGSKTCPTISNKTEAYVASRAVGNAVKQWFEYNTASGYGWKISTLKDFICSNLDLCKSYAESSGVKMRGSMVRPFPSTLAVITFQIINGKLSTEHYWAGDSRTYVLDTMGLGQISVDDIKGEDAMSNLTRDGALTNVLSSDGKFVIHKAHFEPHSPCIMMCSSDGCFGYVSSPMEFELMILSTLEKSMCVDDWQKSLSEEISKRSGDDQTLALAAFGFSNFEGMKSYFYKRYESVYNIVRKFENAEDAERQLIWNQYKVGYYRHEAKSVM